MSDSADVIPVVAATGVAEVAERPGVATARAARASISWGLVAMLQCASLMSGAIGGAVAGYYFAFAAPSIPQVAVLDTDGLLKQALAENPTAIDARRAADRVVEAVQLRVASLVAAGIIVIDRSAVIDAPLYSLVRIEPTEPTQPKSLNSTLGAAITDPFKKRVFNVNGK